MRDSLKKLHDVTEEIVKSYDNYGGINLIDREDLPVRENIYNILEDIFVLPFPGNYGNKPIKRDNLSLYVNSLIDSLYISMKDEIFKAIIFDRKISKSECKDCDETAAKITIDLLGKLPEIRSRLKKDVQASYEGDPAALNMMEIISCYPCIDAIATHRIAHELYKWKIPLVPRIMSERSHHRTGIDIHPGAVIGEYFFIDHGTGVVIGETTKIGNHVKIYQGVTLGALSFPKDNEGKIIKGIKRHPTIEDNTVIYAGATILGGDTVIGRDSIIGTKVTITVNQEVKGNHIIVSDYMIKKIKNILNTIISLCISDTKQFYFR